MKTVAMVMVSVLWGAACAGSGEVGTEADAESAVNATGAQDFDVDFSGCTELAGIGTVPAANARPLVPAPYVLAGDGTTAIVVVRVASCSGTSIDGGKPAAGTVAQIGVTLVGPDATADINNYLLWYVTDSGLLHAMVTAAGLPSDSDPGLTYTFTPDGDGDGTLATAASPPHAPPFTTSGPAQVPTAPPVVFTASWWNDGSKGTVRMRSVFPAIQFGGATTTLTTPAGSALAALIGGTTMTFAILDSRNAFATAHMEVRQTN